MSDRAEPRTRAFVAAFAARGVAVAFSDAAGNFIRAARADEAPVRAVVEVAGLPNLVHEFVHALLSSSIADDYGIPYGEIPFDPRGRAGARLLREELACCVLSCAYLDADESEVRAWFDEQLEIQPVFYGAEGDPARLWRAVAREVENGRAAGVCARAYVQTRRALRTAGASPALSTPVRRWQLAELWAQSRARERLRAEPPRRPGRISAIVGDWKASIP